MCCEILNRFGLLLIMDSDKGSNLTDNPCELVDGRGPETDHLCGDVNEWAKTVVCLKYQLGPGAVSSAQSTSSRSSPDLHSS